MKIGIFGGSFDPLHNGHIKLLDYAKKMIGLDKIIIIPTGENPFKCGKREIGRVHRYSMVESYVDSREDYEISDIEINREGVSYSYHTVLNFVNEEDKLYFIVGSDVLYELDRWHNFSELSKIITFACTKRGKFDNHDFFIQSEYLYNKYNASIILLEDYSPPPFSSSEVRTLLEKGEDVKEFVPKCIYDYIKKNHLYCNDGR